MSTGGPVLPGVLGSLAPLLDRYGYLAVAALIMLEGFGIPTPGQTILIVGAVYAGSGHLNIISVVAIAIAAAVVGDNIGYAIGYRGGRRLVLRFGRYILLTPKRLDTAQRFFTRHGGKVVTIARFFDGLRQANGIIAGTTGMPWRRFLAFNVLGDVLWVGVWAGLGYLAGIRITAIYEQILRYQRYALLTVVLVPTTLIILYLLRRRRTPEQTP